MNFVLTSSQDRMLPQSTSSEIASMHDSHSSKSDTTSIRRACNRVSSTEARLLANWVTKIWQDRVRVADAQEVGA